MDTRKHLSDLSDALQQHCKWKQNFSASMYCRVENQDIFVVSDESCEFGKWLSGAGIKEFGAFPEFQDLQQAHSDFHEACNNIVRLQSQASCSEDILRFWLNKYRLTALSIQHLTSNLARDKVLAVENMKRQ